VDTTAPTISENLPEPGMVVTEQFVEVSIRVSDGGAIGQVSGVDLRTLQYTIDRPLTGQSIWVHPEIDTSVPIVPFQSVNFYIEVEEGENWLIWRVSDAVGNEFKSEPFGILADLPDAGNLEPVVIISEPSSGANYRIDDLVFLDASQSYHPRGDRISFTWTSDIDGLLGTSPRFSDHLSEGIHRISVTVTSDDTGASAEAVVYISVSGVEDTGGPLDEWWEQMALALILVFVLITMLLQRFRIKEWEI
jgi:hypothetical protein